MPQDNESPRDLKHELANAEAKAKAAQHFLKRAAEEIEDLVEAAKKADEELARSREGAEWAGDPDPYRKPAEDEWDEDDEDEDAEDDEDEDE